MCSSSSKWKRHLTVLGIIMLKIIFKNILNRLLFCQRTNALNESLKDISSSTLFTFLLCVLMCHLRSKDVQNYKVPNDAAAGQLRNGHGTFLQGNTHT